MLHSKLFKMSLFIIITLMICSSICNGNEKERLLVNIKNKINACKTKEDAKRFLNYVQNVMDIVQTSFSQLVSTRKIEDVYKIKKNLLYNYFESDACVQISSINSSLLLTQIINDYLNRLTNYNYRYGKVELYFDKEYLAFGNIYEFGPKNNRAYEFNLTASQIFKGYIGDYIQYGDATIKVFNFVFKKVENSWTLKIKSITAKETYSLENYEIDKDTILLKEN